MHAMTHYSLVLLIHLHTLYHIAESEPGDFNELDDKAGAKVAPSPSKDLEDSKESGDASFVRPSTFRVGILQLLTQKHSITETAGIAFVSKIKGDVNAVFQKLDSNGNGQLEPHELKDMLEELGTPPEELTDEELADADNEYNKIIYCGNSRQLTHPNSQLQLNVGMDELFLSSG